MTTKFSKSSGKTPPVFAKKLKSPEGRTKGKEDLAKAAKKIKPGRGNPAMKKLG